jgi:hypothetical protein
MACLAVAIRAGATDFLRGDANGDGVISISDAHFMDAFLFLGGPAPECGDAADTDDNGQMQLTDTVRILGYKFLGGQPPVAPFPNPGPDPTDPVGLLGCDSYGHGSPLDDPAAKMEVLDATATGGNQRRAVITIAVSSTGPIGGYSATILDAEGALETGTEPVPIHRQLVDRTNQFAGGFNSVQLVNGRVTFAFILSFTEGREIDAGQHVPVADIITCLRPGKPAGVYPLTLESGELVASCLLQPIGTGTCPDSGRAIHPTLVSGTLTIENDVASAGCDTSNPPAVPPINISFKLAEKTGTPGGNVNVPLFIRADRESQGFSYSVHFDKAVLQATGTTKIFQTASGTPYEFEKFEENNDTGYVVGAAIISLTDTADVLPPSREIRVLEFHFHIDPLAPLGHTDLEFLDGGRGSGGPVKNKLIASGQDITPDLASSFVFVNGRINIVPDGIPFVRGDSNSDEAVNISDPQFTLDFLFLGGNKPRCMDAADANDDGKVDISDAVTTLRFLFIGDTKLPPPRTPGADPTPDELECEL